MAGERVVVEFQDLLDGFDFVNEGDPGENQAFVDLQTGRVYWHSEALDEREALPGDPADRARFLPIPDRDALGLGAPLAQRFSQANGIAAPAAGDDRGWQRQLQEAGLINRWYEFETAAQRDALVAWCAGAGVGLE